MGQAKRRAFNFNPKQAVGDGSLAGFFFATTASRTEMADDVISCAVIHSVGLNVCVKFGDSMLNMGQIIRHFPDRTRFAHFCAVFNCRLRPTESG